MNAWKNSIYFLIYNDIKKKVNLKKGGGIVKFHKLYFNEEELFQVKELLARTMLIKGFPRETAYRKIEEKINEMKDRDKVFINDSFTL